MMYIYRDICIYIYMSLALAASSNMRQLLLTYFVLLSYHAQVIFLHAKCRSLTNCTLQGDGCREIGQTLHADVDVLRYFVESRYSCSHVSIIYIKVFKFMISEIGSYIG